MRFNYWPWHDCIKYLPLASSNAPLEIFSFLYSLQNVLQTCNATLNSRGLYFQEDYVIFTKQCTELNIYDYACVYIYIGGDKLEYSAQEEKWDQQDMNYWTKLQWAALNSWLTPPKTRCFKPHVFYLELNWKLINSQSNNRVISSICTRMFQGSNPTKHIQIDSYVY